jgi:hypothetical protein
VKADHTSEFTKARALRSKVADQGVTVCARGAQNGRIRKNQEVSDMTRAKALLLTAIVLPLSISAAYAAKRIDPDKLPQVACSELKFSAAFLAKYPKAAAACLDGRVYNGKRYAKFQAKVYISDPAFMTVQMLDATGATVTTFSFKPGPDQGVHVNGKLRKFHDMAVGEVLTVWVSEDRTDAQELPGPTANKWTMLPPL